MSSVAVPSRGQAEWQDYEMGMFIHYDLNVFMNIRSPGWDHRNYDNWPTAAIFNPKKLDTDQWMEAAKALGAKYAVLTASHGTGFMLWQSDAYPFGVRQSPWRGGKGDVVKDFVESCRRYGIKPGLYSHMKVNGEWRVDHPGLVNEGKGGDPEKQARYAKAKLVAARELWGNYGPLVEVWFDGGTPDPAVVGFDVLPPLRELQPDAMVFLSPATTMRWIGNEQGVANYPCWATVPSVEEAMSWEYRGMHHKLSSGDPDGATWLPAECDVPLRKGQWVWSPNEEHLIKPVTELMDIYYKSVGRNCNLLVNANPDADGLIPDGDMKRFKEFGDEIRRRFARSLAKTSGKGTLLELPLRSPASIDHAIVMEEITSGERIREYTLEGKVDGAWKPLSSGQCVGHKRIEEFEPATVSAVRLRVEKSIAEPLIRRLAVFNTRG